MAKDKICRLEGPIVFRIARRATGADTPATVTFIRTADRSELLISGRGFPLPC